MTTWYRSPAARTWTGPDVPGAAHAFHRSLPGYAPTPLVPIPELAAELGVGRAAREVVDDVDLVTAGGQVQRCGPSAEPVTAENENPQGRTSVEGPAVG